MNGQIRQQQDASGFTLIELMVALLISAIVLTGVMSIFSTNYQSYLLQDDAATMQENLRGGAILLERDLQMISSGMIGADRAGGFNMERIDKNGSQVSGNGSLTFENNAGDTSGAGESDRLTIRYNIMNPDKPTEKCGEGKNASGVLPCDQLPIITLASAITSSSKQLTIKESLSTAPYSTWTQSCYCGTATYSKYNFSALITDSDGSGSDVFVITGGPNPTDGNVLQTTSGLAKADGYKIGSKISFFTMRTYKEVMYYIKDNTMRQRTFTYLDHTIDGNPVHASAPLDQPVAENIEDLQFAFRLDIDVNGDGKVDEYKWINNRTLTDAESFQVRLVRISLLGRTSRPNSTFPVSVREAIFAGAGAGANAVEDHSADAIERLTPTIAQSGRYYGRKMIQAVVKVRSLGLP